MLNLTHCHAVAAAIGFFLYFTTYIFFYKQEGRDKRYLIKLLKIEKNELEDLYLEQMAIKRITTESVCN
jgi:hypothetical protein